MNLTELRKIRRKAYYHSFISTLLVGIVVFSVTLLVPLSKINFNYINILIALIPAIFLMFLVQVVHYALVFAPLKLEEIKIINLTINKNKIK